MGENACILSASLIYYGNGSLTWEHIARVLDASKIKVDAYWPIIVAKYFSPHSILKTKCCEDALYNSTNPHTSPKCSTENMNVDEEKSEKDETMPFDLFD